MKVSKTQENYYTILGVLAIVFWGTTIAFSRSLAEQLGAITAASWIYSVSGILGSIYLIGVPNGIKKTLQLPVSYLVFCGILFTSHTVCLYLAIGLAINREQVIEVSIINYLWPAITLIFSIPVLGKRARISLIPGIILALTGFYLVTVQNKILSWEGFKENFQINYFPYIIAFCGAVCWGLYSNLSRHLASYTEGRAVPLFLLFAGLILNIIRIIFFKETYWHQGVVLKILYISIFPTFIGNLFWEKAMQKGRITLVVSLSYFIPLLSITISSLYLSVAIGINLWIACILVVLGAIISKFSIVDVYQKSDFKREISIQNEF